MRINKLRLINYRNYENEEVSFDPHVNILFGDNAQGKTNILEAIFYSARGFSFKNSRESDIIRFREKEAGIKAEIFLNERKKDVEILLYQDRKKEIKINGVNLDRLGELKNQFDVVIFSPEDLKIVKESPQDRRDFLDNLIFANLPSYRQNLNSYNKILQDRNNLLKREKGEFFKESIKVFNLQLAKAASYISYIRNNFIRILNIYASINHKNLTRGRENLKLSYTTNIYGKDLKEKLTNLKDENIKKIRYKIMDKIEEDYLFLLESSLDRDLEYKNTYYGIHKDDFEIYIDDLPAKVYSSQGQQRTAMLAIRLSELDVFKIVKGSNPILLLDDVFSELDDSRSNYLISSVKKYQTIMTTNSLDGLLDKNLEGNTYLIKSGKVVDKCRFRKKE